MNNPTLHSTSKIHYCQFAGQGKTTWGYWQKCGDSNDDVIHGLTSSSSCQSIFLMFCSSSCWAQLRKTLAHLEAAKNYFCQTQLSPSLPPPSRCVCPTSSSLWSPVTESLPASFTHNHILSVTHREEVLRGKKRVSKEQKYTLGLTEKLWYIIVENKLKKKSQFAL